MRAPTWQPRIAIFTHDTFGLGHVRRCMHLAQALSDRAPEAAILVVTGSTAPGVLESRPRNADYVRIPTIVQSGSEANQPPHLPLDRRAVSALRSRLIHQALTGFDPHVFLVDNFPLGSRKELVPTLDALRRSQTRTVLGLRDIVDAPAAVRRQWTRDGIYEALERYFDRVLVYGVPEVLDVVEAYELPSSIEKKVHYCGYVTRVAQTTRSPADVLAELSLPAPWILATVGGGGDGMPLLRAFLRALDLLPDVFSLVVTGPLMGSAERAEVESLAAETQRVIVRGSVTDLPSYMGAADLVVAMGGYNTTAEIVALGCPAVIVPRNWRYGEHANRRGAAVEWEQLLRAQALEKAGLAEFIHPDALNPELLAETLARALRRPRTRRSASWDLGGVRRVTEHLLSLAGEVGAA